MLHLEDGVAGQEEEEGLALNEDTCHGQHLHHQQHHQCRHHYHLCHRDHDHHRFKT